MKLDHNNTTFIIVTFKSENIIHDCLKTLPKDYKKIIVENSGNIKLKEDLEQNYENLEVILSENLGMGTSNNIGIKRCNTKFAYVINPDIKFKENTLYELIKGIDQIDDFAILSPISNNVRYPNYTLSKKSSFSENIISVDCIDGYSMLINKKKFKDNIFFDENFFMYLENDDMCITKKKDKENLYIIKNSLIEHLGGKSSDQKYKKDIELLRNWHWMWSKFYFNKKHHGIFYALLISSKSFCSSIVKYFLYSISLNYYKKQIYKMRLLGILNSILGKPSWYRINFKE
jgi:N-acetylglucosaminyl-diphospho-decaprenol L-rhamnosyltransferase